MKEKPIETCHLGESQSVWSRIKADETSYIHEHLETLKYLAGKIPPGLRILEIGTGPGHSTVALASGRKRNEVITLDIDECKPAKELVKEAGLENVTFFKCDSLDYLPDFIYPFGLIFIDGLHTYDRVFSELVKYSALTDKIVLHDTFNPAHEGVGQAVIDFHRLQPKWKTYNWYNCNGLTVLEK